MATTTFLFTDIEGSTRLWEAHPEAMQDALAAHDAATTKAVEAHGGRVFKHMGDGAIAVFGSAGDAIDAATELQAALAATTHPDVGTLKVRMGIHSGEVEERDGDYFGPTLNRTARLMATGHGGQVLVSLVAAHLAGERQDLIDLGEHRLRDLGTPERIHQVGDGDFPPLRTLDRAPNNLPVFPTSFVGRQQEFEELATLVGGSRLVTLTGVGGAGKTRLALQVAAEVGSSYPDGVWLVELAAVTDPELVDAAFADSLDIGQDGNKTVHQSVLDALARNSTLLVVDNCEHLIGPVADFVDDILAASPDSKVIATSRELLGVPGEVAYGLRSMSVPRKGTVSDPTEASTYEAIQLFAERAIAAKRDFRIDSTNVEAVVEICRRLDGMPLALELAASRVRAFPPAKLADLLDQRFRLLTGGSRTALPRQQTLAATIEWSYRLLDEPEQALLRRLSVFQGGFTYDAAEAVAVGDPVDEFDLLQLIPSLVDKSLVVADDLGGEPRYRLLETIRQFARDLLEDTDEAEAVRQLHAEHFDRFAHEAGRNLRGPDETMWWERVEQELDNLRHGITWAVEHDRPELALSIATGCWRFWWFKGRWSEGVDWIEPLLASADGLPPLLEGEARLAIASLGLNGGERNAAYREHFEVAREIFVSAHERRDPGLRGSSLTASHVNLAAYLSNIEGDYEASDALNRAAWDLAEELGESMTATVAAGNLAMSHTRNGDYDEARTWLAKATEVAEAIGSAQRLADLQNQAALLAVSAGDWETAIEAMSTSAELHRSAGQDAESDRQLNRVETFRLAADADRPGRALRDAIAVAAAHTSVVRSTALLSEYMASSMVAAGRDEDHGRVAVAHGSFDRLVGLDFIELMPDFFKVMVHGAIEAARQSLGEERFVELDGEGRRSTRPQMVDFLTE
jgi:predicted ATPase/class 3 adenylate cyclase